MVQKFENKYDIFIEAYFQRVVKLTNKSHKPDEHDEMITWGDLAKSIAKIPLGVAKWYVNWNNLSQQVKDAVSGREEAGRKLIKASKRGEDLTSVNIGTEKEPKFISSVDEFNYYIANIPVDGEHQPSLIHQFMIRKKTYSDLAEELAAEQEPTEEENIEHSLGMLSGRHASRQTSTSSNFRTENDLEEYIYNNWDRTDFGKHYDLIGRQYYTDTGPLDLLAISKDRTKYLVIELKKGQASDDAVGQILRYMSFIGENVAKENQKVEGAIIALDANQRLYRAVREVPNVRFYKYEMSTGRTSQLLV